MSLHTDSGALAHNLDRFDFHADFELVASEAARLSVATETIRFYRDRYGDEPVIVTIMGLASRMPAYEFQVRKWILGERIKFNDQVANAT